MDDHQHQSIHPRNTVVKRPEFDPWLGKIPWRRKWQPTPVLLLENPMDGGGWWSAVDGVAKSQTLLSTHTHTPHQHQRKG